MDDPEPIKLNSLFYADDICVVASNKESFEDLLFTCERHAFSHNYKFNVAKCEYIYRGPTISNPTVETLEGPIERRFCIHDGPMKQVTTFTYLGIPFNVRGIDTTHHINVLRGKAIRVVNMCSKAGFNAYGISYWSKRSLYSSQIRPIVEYSLSTIPMNKKELQKIGQIQDQALKKAFSVCLRASGEACSTSMCVPSMKLRKTTVHAGWIHHLENLTEDHLITKLYRNTTWKIANHQPIPRKSSFYNIHRNAFYNKYKERPTPAPAPARAVKRRRLNPNSRTRDTQIAAIDPAPIQTEDDDDHISERDCRMYGGRNRDTDRKWERLKKEAMMEEIAEIYASVDKTQTMRNLQYLNINGEGMPFYLDHKLFPSKECQRMVIWWIFERYPGAQRRCRNCRSQNNNKIHMLHCSGAWADFRSHRPNLNHLEDLLQFGRTMPLFKRKISIWMYCKYLIKSLNTCLRTCFKELGRFPYEETAVVVDTTMNTRINMTTNITPISNPESTQETPDVRISLPP